jgi:hypothetical protein
VATKRRDRLRTPTMSTFNNGAIFRLIFAMLDRGSVMSSLRTASARTRVRYLFSANSQRPQTFALLDRLSVHVSQWLNVPRYVCLDLNARVRIEREETRRTRFEGKLGQPEELTGLLISDCNGQTLSEILDMGARSSSALSTASTTVTQAARASRSCSAWPIIFN